MTAEGLAIPDFNYALLQPMTSLSVETWADFTSRLVRVVPGMSCRLRPQGTALVRSACQPGLAQSPTCSFRAPPRWFSRARPLVRKDTTTGALRACLCAPMA